MSEITITAEIEEDYDGIDAPKDTENKTYLVIDGIAADDWEDHHDFICQQLHGLLAEDCGRSPLGVGVVDDIAEDVGVAVPHIDDVPR